MKEEIQLPTVGRIVWVKRFDGDTEIPAIVQRVNYGTNIDACVFGAKGPEMLQSLMHRSDMGTHGAAWEWMPYQKGQAAKTEALEQELKGAFERGAVQK